MGRPAKRASPRRLAPSRSFTKGIRTRERIIEIALELASRDGLGGITIGALADYVGMSKGGLYAHFGSKEELQLQVLDTAIARFRADVVEPVLNEEAGLPRLRAILERWIRWDGQKRLPGGCPFVAFAAELDEQTGGARDALVAAYALWMAFLDRVVTEAVEAGDLPPSTDPRLCAFLLQGILLSYHQASHLRRDPDARSTADRALESLLATLGATRRS